MPRHIVNEGRVVGYGAYETYVKQLLSEDPTAIPATEKEWLNSMMSIGDSMLLRIGVDTIEGPHFRDIAFPQNTGLAAANTIMAHFFVGRGRYAGAARCNPSNADTQWCTEVTDYGPLLHNKDTNYPIGRIGPDISLPANEINPPNTTSNRTLLEWNSKNLLDQITRNEMTEYTKIIDGLIIHPGNWESMCTLCYQPVGSPHTAACANKGTVTQSQTGKLLDPNFDEDWPEYVNNQYPRLRLLLSDKIDRPFYVILSGFTHKSIVHGVTHTKSTGMLTDPHFPSPQDGAFLGPSEWPWAAKVVFSSPSGYLNYYYSNAYRRQLRPTTVPGNSSDGFNNYDPLYDASNPALVPSDRGGSSTPGQVTLDERVRLNPIIDMENTNPATYYARLHDQRNASRESLLVAASRVRLNVVDMTPEGDNNNAATPLNDPTTDGLAVFTTYSRSDILPPALYGTRVTRKGIHADQALNPIDVVSPGTLKVYHGHIKDRRTVAGTTELVTGSSGTTTPASDQPIDKARALELIPENRALLRKSSNYTWHQLDGNDPTKAADGTPSGAATGLSNVQVEPTVSSTDTRKSERNYTNHVPNIRAQSRNLIPVAETYYNQIQSGGIVSTGFPGLDGAQPASGTDTFVDNEFISSGAFRISGRTTSDINQDFRTGVPYSSPGFAGRPQIVRITTGKQSKAVLSMEDATGKMFKTSGQISGIDFRERINVTGREGDSAIYHNQRNNVPQSGGAGQASGTGAAGTNTSIVGNRSRRSGHGHSGFPFQDNLSWDHLLQALANNQRIDLIGDELKDLRDNLPNIVSDGYLRIEGNVISNPHAAYNPRGPFLNSPGADTASPALTTTTGSNTTNSNTANTRNGAGNTGHSWINHDLIVGTSGQAQGSLVVHGTRDSHIRGSLMIGNIGDQRNLVVNSHLRVNDTAGKERFYVNGTTGDTQITGASSGAFFRVRDNSGTDRTRIQSDNGRTEVGIGTTSITDNRLYVNGATHITGHTTVGTGIVTSAAGYSTGSPSLTVSGLITGNTLNSILNYIIVGGIRLYVSHTNPGNPPVNSVGIGWT